MDSTVAILLLGVLLGARHAFDADHLVAVTSIVSEYRNPLRAIWVGVSWGLGHTVILVVVGAVILLVRAPIPETAAYFFELAVGLMLAGLGLQIIWKLRRNKVHVHSHAHEGKAHIHFHSHAETPAHAHHRPGWRNLAEHIFAAVFPGENRLESLMQSLKPAFRLKSFLVGVVHGLAGSAALMLLVLASLESPWTGFWYIVVFGAGSIVSMGLVTIFLTMPFSASSRLPWLARAVQSAAAIFSVLFGVFLALQSGMAIAG